MTALDDALAALRAGQPVIVPTETVYGVAVDARNPVAIERLLTLKGGRDGKPLPVQVPSSTEAAWLCTVSETASRLMDAHWPGPLTLVLPCHAELPDAVTAGTGSLGLRCPAHPLMLALLQAFGGPLAVPSANRSGEPPPTTAEAATVALPGLLVLDGGTAAGEPSTVLSLVGTPRVLRQGHLRLDLACL